MSNLMNKNKQNAIDDWNNVNGMIPIRTYTLPLYKEEVKKDGWFKSDKEWNKYFETLPSKPAPVPRPRPQYQHQQRNEKP